MAIADLPYLHALGDGGPRSRTQLVVIHATDNTASAAAEASYATHREDGTSAHFYVDDDEAYRALPLGNVAYGCFPHGNAISVQFELCGRSNEISDATMRRAAPLVAEVCRMYGLPPEAARVSQLVRAGMKGICGHDTITATFPEDGGDHTDPGASFPWSTFIGYVRGGAFMALSDQDQANMLAAITRLDGAVAGGKKPTAYGYEDGGALGVLVAAAQAEKARDAAAATAVAGLRSALDTLAQALATGSGSVDVAAILARVDQRADEVRQLVEQRHAEEMAALDRQRLAELEAAQAEIARLTAAG